MPDFIPGIQLNEAYYWEAVRPILDKHFPNLPHTAALIGYSSDVLGFDTPISCDHLWGPRLMMFLPPENFTETSKAVDQVLRNNLPYTFKGYSTNFGEPDLLDGGTRLQKEIDKGPVAHLIHFYTIEQFWQQELGVNPFDDPDSLDWFTFHEQRLLSLTAGKVYHDDLGLEDVRKWFAYYPQDVWLCLLAAQWALIAQEEAFVGRTHQVGDDLGSAIVAARLVERFIHLCFLMEKRYASYSKWLGTAFKQLNCYPAAGPVFENILSTSDYTDREPWLAQAYTMLAEMHNALRITPLLETCTHTYSGWHQWRAGVKELLPGDPRDMRPFQVIFAGRFVDAILDAVQDKELLSRVGSLGSINQFLVESCDALQSVQFCRKMKDVLSWNGNDKGIEML